MPVHKQIFGGGKYLSFALNKLRQLVALAALSGGYGGKALRLDDGTLITLKVIQANQSLSIVTPTLLSYSFRTTDEYPGGVFSLALINPDAGQMMWVTPSIQNFLGPSYAAFNSLFPVGDGYHVRWQMQGPGFADATYTGRAADTFCPIMEATGSPTVYQYGDSSRPDGHVGVYFNSPGVCFKAHADGLGMTPMASHGLSITPLGQYTPEGEYRWAAMGREYVGETFDIVTPTAPKLPQYAPTLFTVGTREKVAYSIGPVLAANRMIDFSKLYAIGRGRALFVVSYPRELASTGPDVFKPDLAPQVIGTPDFGASWFATSAPFITVKPAGTAAVGTILCETGKGSGQGVYRSVFAPMSRDGKKILWLLPQCSVANGAGWDDNVTVVLRSTDAGLSFAPITIVPAQHTLDAFWYRDRVFGENCFWFYGSADATGTGASFNRWITMDAGSTWRMVPATEVTGDFVCTKPYVDAETTGYLYAPRYLAEPKTLGIKRTTGLFDETKDALTMATDTLVLPPTPNFTEFCVAPLGDSLSLDRVYPALPTLMRIT